ncbi:leucine--tRNA ligase [bacterium]|nr:leucine--tRNA ligase [bacterium]
MGLGAVYLLISKFASEGNANVNAVCDDNIESFSSSEWNGFSSEKQQELLLKYRLTYLAETEVNWCPALGTVLANDEIVNGVSERGGHPVVRKKMTQWSMRISAYAERLLQGLDQIDWTESLKESQRNWIGKSVGASVTFKVNNHDEVIEVFTTRPDTLWGVTYMVLAPEHPSVKKITSIHCHKYVEKYLEKVNKETEIYRTSLDKEKTGVFTGAFCINPVNGEKIPVWIADYVLSTYGTGAVMAVPGHDERDFEFAKKFGLPICEVISPDGKKHEKLDAAYIDPGVMVQSGPFSGQPSDTNIPKVIDYLKEKEWGGARVNYKLRDWLISRQRYWGAPIPIVVCEKCGIVPVPEDQLPVLLPEKVEFKGTGESPLLTNEEWVNTQCPTCGGRARREVDTMDTFVCSSWYYLRFLNPDLKTAAFDSEMVRKWLPVDQYVGGAEHAVMHLMYARFFMKVLYDLGYVDHDEPFTKLVHQGVITNLGAKMSKSRGNVINPDGYIDEYGSDVFRMYMMFMGSYTDGGDWSDDGIQGMNRFLNRIWRLFEMIDDSPPLGKEKERIVELDRQRHYAVKMVTQDLNRFHFNTAISRIMELVNALYLYIQDLRPDQQNQKMIHDVLKTLVQLIAPFAPHLGEELWHRMNSEDSVFNSKWPDWNEKKLQIDQMTVVVQVNGKLRSRIQVEANSDDQIVKDIALKDPKIKKYIESKKITKVVVIRNKLVSIVVK